MNQGIHLQAIAMLHGLWLLPPLALLLVLLYRQRRKTLTRLLAPAMAHRLTPAAAPGREILGSILFLLALALLITALARPAWNKQEVTVARRGRDVVFLVDVSRSMLAEDLVPNRLERAKLAIKDCVDVLQGDRVALVAFAGKSKILAPLTTDYGFFRQMVDQITVDIVDRGGTMLGDSLRFIMQKVFDQQASQYRDIILITDGEDHESFPLEAARAAGEKKIRLLIVGLGNEEEGKRIPITDAAGNRTFLKYQGREIWSRLDGDTLRQMAAATPGGRYLPVATGTIDLGQVYRDLVTTAAKQQQKASKTVRYQEKFQIPLAIAVALLILELLLANRRPGPATIMALFLLLPLALPAAGQAAGAAGLVEQGLAAYQAKKYDKALQLWQQAGKIQKDQPEILANQGNALYQLQRYDEAVAAWKEAGRLSDQAHFQNDMHYNQANALFRQANEQEKQAPQAALESYRRSSNLFRQVLNRDPALSQAAVNLEMSNRRIARLRQQLQKTAPQSDQQEQSGRKDNQHNKQKADNNDQAGQNQALDKLKQKQQQLQQQTKARQTNPQQARQLAREQQQLAEKSQQMARQSASKEQAEALQQAAQAQQDAARELQRQNPQAAIEKQQQALDQLQAAQQAADKQQPQDQADQQRPAAPSREQQPGEEQPQKSAAKPTIDQAIDRILEQERTARRMLRLAPRQPVPVEKDW